MSPPRRPRQPTSGGRGYRCPAADNVTGGFLCRDAYHLSA
ncbi:hypothetical protein T265_16178, partial [Opisthorchis viverrini]